MRILVISPQPFYQPRGTPIAVDLLIRVLSERGDIVDVLTFHEGADRLYMGCTMHRIRPFVRVKEIRPGLSGKKLYCDVHLFFQFISLIRKERYDLVHAVEEGAFMALLVCRTISMPFIYDMDSSMTTQVVNKLPFLKPGRKLLAWMERLPMRYATAVVSVCDALAEDAVRAGAKEVVVLKDISLLQLYGENGDSMHLRDKLALPRKIAMYIGNLESYQGIDLMLDSFALLRSKTDDVALVVIGGADADIHKYQAMSVKLGINRAVHFLGPRPIESLGHYMTQADMLISPRIEGVNTPMKIYTYLDSGVPVVATDLPMHKQVVNDRIAMLAPPEKVAFSQAMFKLIEDEPLCGSLADQARQFIAREHSYAAFKSTIHRLYDSLEKTVCKRIA